jgi:hypothetical protein
MLKLRVTAAAVTVAATVVVAAATAAEVVATAVVAAAAVAEVVATATAVVALATATAVVATATVVVVAATAVAVEQSRATVSGVPIRQQLQQLIPLVLSSIEIVTDWVFLVRRSAVLRSELLSLGIGDKTKVPLAVGQPLV